MSSNQSCNACAFYEDHTANSGKVSADAGLCRVNPPISQQQPDSRGFWPVVSSEDWCGKFSAERTAS